VIDAGWIEPSRQIGAIGHLSGIKKSEFVIAINSDKDALISEVADVLTVADLKQLVPLLTKRIAAG